MSFPYLILPRATSGEGDGTLLQYSCLENPMDGEAWWAAVHGVAESEISIVFCALAFGTQVKALSFWVKFLLVDWI